MAAKKPKDEPLSAQELLEARVDAMMDAKTQRQPQQPLTSPAEPVGAPSLPGKKAVVPSPEPVVDPPAPIIPPEETPPVAAASQAETEPEDIQIGPENLDTPQSDAAIADIVAQEADMVLAAEDAGVASAELAADENTPEEPRRHGHPVLWFCVALLAILVVISAVLLVNPNLTPSFGP